MQPSRKEIKETKTKLESAINPYECGGASLKIKEEIKSFNLTNILDKSFYNL